MKVRAHINCGGEGITNEEERISEHNSRYLTKRKIIQQASYSIAAMEENRGGTGFCLMSYFNKTSIF